MKHRARFFALAAAAFLAACSPKGDLRMAVEVVSAPGEANVTFKGRSLGSTPAALEVRSFDELMSIAASREGAPVAEKRIRILSPDSAQLVFRFGEEASEVAKRLGLAQVLVRAESPARALPPRDGRLLQGRFRASLGLPAA